MLWATPVRGAHSIIQSDTSFPRSAAIGRINAGIVFAALAPNTRRAYETNLTAFAAWIGNEQPTDPKLAEYLQCAFDCGNSPASLRMIAASVQWLFTSTDQPSPAGKRCKAKIKQLSEAGADRGRGQAKPLTYDNAVSMLTIGNPLDKAIVALAKQAGISHRLAAHSGRVGLASD